MAYKRENAKGMPFLRTGGNSGLQVLRDTEEGVGMVSPEGKPQQTWGFVLKAPPAWERGTHSRDHRPKGCLRRTEGSWMGENHTGIKALEIFSNTIWEWTKKTRHGSRSKKLEGTQVDQSDNRPPSAQS